MQDEPNEAMPRKAAVAPRARRVGSDVSLRLDQLILPYVQSGAKGVIYIIAPAGAGKTTAINHLRAILPADADFACFDEPQFDHWMDVVGQKLVIVATARGLAISPLERFELASWTEDDCCEYLAATHRAQCSSVMKRLTGDSLFSLLAGSPAHLRAVMDQMAGDEEVPSIGQSLRRAVRRLAGTDESYERILRCAEDIPRGGRSPELGVLAVRINPLLAQFCTNPAVSISLSCERNAMLLADGLPAPCLDVALDRPALEEMAVTSRARRGALRTLDTLVHRSGEQSGGMAASIRIAGDPSWRPSQAKCLNLSGAILVGAKWAKLNLSHTNLQCVSLARADLKEAVLREVNGFHSNLAGANLHGATLEGARFSGACFDRADLSDLNGSWSFLNASTFRGANLTAAVLNQAALGSAHLEGASLVAVQFIGAHLYRTRVKDAIFDRAEFIGAQLKDIDMSAASWLGASFENSRIVGCILDGLEMPHANFTAVDFTSSTLTSSRIPAGRFQRAYFSKAGLADIDWPNADLREADFTNASFHMGSSRSGLVGSVIPCEGSKTGFYTDDFNEQDFKSPEEIRKANLCGADLRGAKVDGTDWYLVDLRGAKYTPDQAEYFARCKAILHSRVAD